MNERVLDDVFGVFRRPEQPIHCVVEPVLITTDQLPERRRPALQALADEPLLVGVHGSCSGNGTRVGARKFPDPPGAPPGTSPKRVSPWFRRGGGRRSGTLTARWWTPPTCTSPPGPASARNSTALSAGPISPPPSASGTRTSWRN